ncbi:MAG: hypothetical protein ACRDHW_17655, partial [Ktedonobacteraceae bacterium]
RSMRVRDEEIGVVVEDGCLVELLVHKIVKNGYLEFLETHGCIGWPVVTFPEGTIYELDPEYEGTRYEIALGYGQLIWEREDGVNTLIIPRQP